MNNPSLIETNNLSRQKKLEELGLTPEKINQNKELIKIVLPSDAGNTGYKLILLISEKKYDEENEEKYNKLLEYIKDGANLSYETAKGNFPLLICAKKGYLKTFLTLLKFGANINQVNKNKTSVIMAAARHGYVDILEISILMGGDVNALCFDGDTALMMAKRHGMEKCYQILIKNNALISTQNCLNQTSLDINTNGSVEIDDTKHYSEVFKIRSAHIIYKEAMNLISEATNRLNEIMGDIPVEMEDISGVIEEKKDEVLEQDNINHNFKVRK